WARVKLRQPVGDKSNFRWAELIFVMISCSERPPRTSPITSALVIEPEVPGVADMVCAPPAPDATAAGCCIMGRAGVASMPGEAVDWGASIPRLAPALAVPLVAPMTPGGSAPRLLPAPAVAGLVATTLFGEDSRP